MERSPVLLKTPNKTIEIFCEVANNPHKISKGLMGRKVMSQDSGMIFLFPYSQQSNFWMLNTFIPLSIAFFDEEGKIIDIQDMEPNTLNPHSPPSPFKGALEMNQGWFEKHAINISDFITIPEKYSPLMLNEEIYYNDAYAKTTHHGLEIFDDISDDNQDFITWDEVDDNLINRIYPRVLNPKGALSSKIGSQLNSSRISLEDLPGTAAFIERHGRQKFDELDQKSRETLGFDSVSGAENVRLLTNDITENFNSNQIERASNWYEEYRKIADLGSQIGIDRSIMSASIALQSPRASWLPRSDNTPHSGNQQEPLMQAIVMKRLATSGLYIPEEVITKYKQQPLIIPAGTHDLSTLSDAQITMLPILDRGSAIFKGNREKSIGLMRRSLTGEQFDPEEMLSWFTSPKSNSFYHADVHDEDCHTLDCPNKLFNTVIDTHVINILGNQFIKGSDVSKFKKATQQTFKDNAESFIKRQERPYRPGYEYLASVFENGRELSSSLDEIKMSKNSYQALNWCGQIIRGVDISRSKLMKKFIDSPRDKIFNPFSDHHPQNEFEEQLHELLSR